MHALLAMEGNGIFGIKAVIIFFMPSFGFMKVTNYISIFGYHYNDREYGTF